jgi:hypothetical protein
VAAPIAREVIKAYLRIEDEQPAERVLPGDEAPREGEVTPEGERAGQETA